MKLPVPPKGSSSLVFGALDGLGRTRAAGGWRRSGRGIAWRWRNRHIRVLPKWRRRCARIALCRHCRALDALVPSHQFNLQRFDAAVGQSAAKIQNRTLDLRLDYQRAALDDQHSAPAPPPPHPVLHLLTRSPSPATNAGSPSAAGAAKKRDKVSCVCMSNPQNLHRLQLAAALRSRRDAAFAQELVARSAAQLDGEGFVIIAALDIAGTWYAGRARRIAGACCRWVEGLRLADWRRG